ncbi:hypothetical protein BDBG_17228 [Blastomyces gilchristii SLH14081]|uniref:Secreted protein n=1 Tax=Blastomyces gilchristii (strain SLH14081) TaxID=559298 RepID=A0A179UNS7_BLAGS|nr:uncharacterized protein BDBG_17228 [Blastomyces gilchristii SLH14081]OAT09483.1 hypothetical protein BDBG_17228 [Blastomyces gilchristii SLH14081]
MAQSWPALYLLFFTEAWASILHSSTGQPAIFSWRETPASLYFFPETYISHVGPLPLFSCWTVRIVSQSCLFYVKSLITPSSETMRQCAGTELTSGTSSLDSRSPSQNKLQMFHPSS